MRKINLKLMVEGEEFYPREVIKIPDEYFKDSIEREKTINRFIDVTYRNITRMAEKAFTGKDYQIIIDVTRGK